MWQYGGIEIGEVRGEVMRVFVLCTGRCGSTTFTYACRHMTNFTAAHESRAKFAGSERLEYPDNHIEIDNRLSWFLGRLEQTYGDNAYYVHLTRDARKVAESYARKMENPASIGAAHKRSILMNSPQEDLKVCLDVVDTMRANIEFFLRDKAHVMHVSVENAAEEFSQFWHWIGAEGDEEAALAEWLVFYNDSKEQHGAIRPPIPKSELAILKERYSALSVQTKELKTLLAKTEARFESSDAKRRQLAEKLRASELQIVDLERQNVKRQILWIDETRNLRRELANKTSSITKLQNDIDVLKVDSNNQAEAMLEVIKQREAIVVYADQLEARFLAVLRSHTWKVFAPYRYILRLIKQIVLGKPQRPNSLPERPKVDAVAKSSSKNVTRKSKEKTVSVVRKLDKRLWGGFSQSSFAELKALADDPEQPVKERAEATYSLARWYSVQGDYDGALRQITSMRILSPKCAKEPRQFLPEALFLCRLGRVQEARRILESTEVGFNSTVQLMLANTWNPAVAEVPAVEAELKVLKHLNSVYDYFGIGIIAKRDPNQPLSLDNLRADRADRGVFDSEGKVTVIMPVFDAQDTILTALTSVAEQTWQNLEVLIVDDASTDGTTDIVSEFCASDRRFRLLRQTQNGGSYVCRNRALEEATGVYVTIHDSDDWSHPDKIRSQVEDIRERPAPYNLGMWVRTTSSLSFFGNSRTLHDLVRPDHSSGLFPRETFHRFGAWDAVRISADTELYWRIESALGNKKWMLNRRQVLQGCPLSFGRMSETSLTQAGATSVMTIYHGVRREYRDAADFWHSRKKSIDDGSPSTRRRPFFPVPVLMDPTDKHVTTLSLLLIADWNSGGSILELVKQMVQAADQSRKDSIGLFHYPHYDSDVSAALHVGVRGFAWDNGMRVVSPGEALEVTNVLVLTPAVFEHPLDRLPSITHRRIFAVVTERGNGKSLNARPDSVNESVDQKLKKVWGSEAEWIKGADELQHKLGEFLGVDEGADSSIRGPLEITPEPELKTRAPGV